VTGASGIGKTSLCLAAAHELGVSLDHDEWGGLFQLPAGLQSLDNVREVTRHLRYRPTFGSGYRALILNEIDQAHQLVWTLLLDFIENLPERTLLAMTTNEIGRLPSRLIDRAEHFPLQSDSDEQAEGAQELVNRIWLAETGDRRAPSVDSLGFVWNDDGISYRKLIQQYLSPKIRERLARKRPPEAEPEGASTAADAPNEESTALELTDEKRRIARLLTQGCSGRQIALELGIPRGRCAREIQALIESGIEAPPQQRRGGWPRGKPRKRTQEVQPEPVGTSDLDGAHV